MSKTSNEDQCGMVIAGLMLGGPADRAERNKDHRFIEGFEVDDHDPKLLHLVTGS